MNLHLLASLLIIAAGAVLIARRMDVRLVLFLCSAALFAVAGKFPTLFVKLAEEMTNARTVVPICSAMGFAHVLKLTGCEKDLIHLLLRPVRAARWLMIPGGFVVGFIVNSAIVSQSSSIAAVGPVLLPLLIAAEVPAAIAGTVLLLGCSCGGELCNPGAVELVTLSAGTGIPATALVQKILPTNLAACATVMVVFWLLSRREMSVWNEELERREQQFPATLEVADPPPAGAEPAVQQVRPLRALVPLLPLILLFTLPHTRWLPAELTGHVLIGAAMLAGVAVAGMVVPEAVPKLSGAFFEGAGWAYAHILSLIFVATLFADGIKANGLIDAMATALAQIPGGVKIGSIAVPWTLATVSGTGVAPGVAVIKALIPIAQRLEKSPVLLGTLAGIAAQFGRTMSPVAPVVIMSSALAGVPVPDLVRRAYKPLLAGGVVLLIIGLLR